MPGNTAVERQSAYEAWYNASRNPKVPQADVDALKSALDVLDNKLASETGTRQASGPFHGLF